MIADKYLTAGTVVGSASVQVAGGRWQVAARHLPQGRTSTWSNNLSFASKKNKINIYKNFTTLQLWLHTCSG
jgi:hypothetical protein